MRIRQPPTHVPKEWSKRHPIFGEPRTCPESLTPDTSALGSSCHLRRPISCFPFLGSRVMVRTKNVKKLGKASRGREMLAWRAGDSLCGEETSCAGGLRTARTPGGERLKQGATRGGDESWQRRRWEIPSCRRGILGLRGQGLSCSELVYRKGSLLQGQGQRLLSHPRSTSLHYSRRRRRSYDNILLNSKHCSQRSLKMMT